MSAFFTSRFRVLFLLALSQMGAKRLEGALSGDYQVQRLYKSGDVIIGGLFPVHLKKDGKYCSELRSRALVWAETMIATIEEINRNSDFASNFTLGYDIRDTCSNEQAGIETAADFVFQNNLVLPDSIFKFSNACVPTQGGSRPTVAVIGGEDTRVSMNVANVLQLEDVPQISYGATSAELSDPQYTSFFRTVPPDRYQSKAMVDLVLHGNWTCVAVIGVDDGYGRSGVDEFVKEAKTKDICIVARDLFPVHDSEERIEQLIRKLKAMKHVEILILYSLPSQAIKVFEEAVKQDLVGKTWIASDGWSTSTYIQEPRFIPVLKGTLGFEFHYIQFDELERHLLNVSPLTHTNPWWAEFWEENFNCLLNSSSAEFKRCSGNDSISTQFYQDKLKSVLNGYVRDAVYVVAHALEVLSQCHTPSSCVRPGSVVRPEDVLSSLRNVSFQGMTGLLDYEKLRSQAQAGYDIVNLQVDKSDSYRLVKVGKWDAKESVKLKVYDDRIQWNQDQAPRSTCGEVCPPGTYSSDTIACLWDCVSCDVDHISESPGSTECRKCPKAFISNARRTKCVEVPVQSIRWEDSWGIGIALLTTLCFSVSLAALVVSAIYRKSPIFAETHPTLNMLLIVLLSGAYLMNNLQVSEFSATNTYCRIIPFWFYLVYNSALGAMLLKTYRIRFRISLPPDQAATRLGWKPYLAVSLASLVPVFLILLLLTIDPPTLQKTVVSRLVVHQVCESEHASVGLVLRALSVAYTSVYILFILVASYRTKSLPRGQKFHEAKHIAFAVTIVAISFATFYPGWYFIEGPVKTIFACSTNITAATGILGCLFVPKINILLRHPTWNNRTCIRPSAPVDIPPSNSFVIFQPVPSQSGATPSPGSTGRRGVRFSIERL